MEQPIFKMNTPSIKSVWLVLKTFLQKEILIYKKITVLGYIYINFYLRRIA